MTRIAAAGSVFPLIWSSGGTYGQMFLMQGLPELYMEFKAAPG